MTWEFIVGTILDFVGFGLGALAARLLPLFLSQTVISANLVITAVLSVKLLGIRLTRAEWTSIAVVCSALVLLATAAGPEGSGDTPIATHWWLLAISLLLMVGGTVVVRLLGARAAILAGLLSGLGFGALGVGVRVLNGVDPFDLGALLTTRRCTRSWWPASAACTCTRSPCRSARSTARRRRWWSARPCCRA